MNTEEIIRRLETIAKHAVHTPGEIPFVMSLDDGIALHEAVELLRTKQEDEMLKQKEYDIEADCMYDREHFEWVTTGWQCGCCHAQVQRTDTECWHCKSKLRRKNEGSIYPDACNSCNRRAGCKDGTDLSIRNCSMKI